MLETRSKWISVGGLIMIGVLLGVVLTSQLGWMPPVNHDSRQIPVMEASYAPVNETLDLEKTSKAFSSVSKAILPTVVSISTSKVINRSNDDFFNNPFFRDFFGQEPPKQQQRMQGLGSGVLVSGDGYILTNHHVIKDADDIKVTLYDKRSFDAELVGTDALTEIAVVKIKGKDLPAARLGDSDDLEIGEWVLAVGNPLNLTSTVTAGIVSAMSRKINIIGDDDADRDGGSFAIENFIQTDAAINPGNSGGALVNLKAEVIGINTAIATRTGGYQGYGFAVPINLARKVMNDLIEKGYVTRAYLGIGMRPVSEAIAQRYKMDRPRGVLIDVVMDDSPARKAGLKPLDILLEVNGEEMDEPNEVQNYIALKNPGETVTLKLIRQGKEKVVKVTLGQKEIGKEEETAVTAEDDDLPDLGLHIQNLTDEIRQRYDEFEDENGVLVTSVDQFSAAEDAQIIRGDLIYKIEDVPVESVADYRNALKSFEKGQVAIFYLKRQSRDVHAFVKIPK
ncbi:Do family serine endopeptidase [bacterium]|nr:Do family serine endopeptidase [bacterium]